MISQWFAFADQRPAVPRDAGGQRAAGRASCATARTRTSRRRSTCRSARTRQGLGPGRAGPGQGAQLQQLRRRRRRARAGRRIRATAEPTAVDRQARQSVRRGAARRRSIEAYRAALACDAVSAFGGIVAVNRPLDGPTAEAITEIFTEVVVAPGADEAARAAFAAQEELAPAAGRRAARSAPRRPAGQVRSPAALLVQSRDNGAVPPRRPQGRDRACSRPSGSWRTCLFAWTVARHVKSNAIVFARDGVTAGIGAGQMNRRDSARIAAMRAREAAEAAGWNAAADGRQRDGLGRVPAVRRRARRGDRGRRHRGDPAGRRDARRRSDRPRRRRRHRHGLHRACATSATERRNRRIGPAPCALLYERLPTRPFRISQ